VKDFAFRLAAEHILLALLREPLVLVSRHGGTQAGPTHFSNLLVPQAEELRGSVKSAKLMCIITMALFVALAISVSLAAQELRGLMLPRRDCQEYSEAPNEIEI
jgi:hypothetical protein